jgi:hypothetical protein
VTERFTLYVMAADRGGYHASMHGMGGAVLGVATNKTSRTEALAAAFNEATRHELHGSFLGEQMKGDPMVGTGED